MTSLMANATIVAVMTAAVLASCGGVRGAGTATRSTSTEEADVTNVLLPAASDAAPVTAPAIDTSVVGTTIPMSATTELVSTTSTDGDASLVVPPVEESVAVALIDELRTSVGRELVAGPIATLDGWYAVTAERRVGPVDLWHLADTVWEPANERLQADLVLVDQFELIDLDDDGAPEILVTMTLNGFVGSVLRYETGAWVEIAYGDELGYSRESGLTGIWNDCEPSCADGTMRRYQLIWGEDGFIVVYLD